MGHLCIVLGTSRRGVLQLCRTQVVGARRGSMIDNRTVTIYAWTKLPYRGFVVREQDLEARQQHRVDWRQQDQQQL